MHNTIIRRSSHKHPTFMWTMILSAFLLGGCSEHDDNSCPGPHDIEYDYVDQSGLYIEAPAVDVFATNEEIVNIYREVEACIGVPSTPGPTVWFRNFTDMGLGGAWGFTHYVGQLIAINTDADERNCTSDKQALRHEYVHYITYMNGLQHDHGSQYFEQCGAVGVRTCNGVPCE